MGLFQRAPQTAEEIEASRPLDIPPEVVAEMDEQEWYERAYRGADTPQLTLRAVLMGATLGFFLAFTNLYVGLKTGWALGVALTACILSYSIWQGLAKAGLVKGEMTILENNCMQSAASSSGYSTGVLCISALPAMLILSVDPAHPNGQHLPWGLTAMWILSVAALGVTMAVPMKRSLINRERLKFPSGIAAASTLQSLYASGEEAVKKSRALLWSALVAGLFPLAIDLNVIAGKGGEARRPIFDASSAIFDWLPSLGQRVDASGKVLASTKLSDWTIVLDHNPVMIGAGALVGLRVAISMTAAGLFLALFAGPLGWNEEWLAPSGKVLTAVSKPGATWKEIGLWLGAPLMVSASIMAIAVQWRTFLRAFRSATSKEKDSDSAIAESPEVPIRWVGVGLAISGASVITLGAIHFDVPPLWGLVAVLLTFVLTLVAARATGESDITPMGAMGKITQLTYGVLIPQSTTANIMTAGITTGASMSCADLLNDLKSGYLLGADPRRQFLAQLSGIFGGTVASVLGYYILIPDASTLLGSADAPPQFPAPAAQAWRAVAELFRDGIANMHPMHRDAIVVGLAVGVVLTILETLLPKYRKWLPSATGLGLGLILPFQYPLSMLIGAAIVHFWQQRDEASAKRYMIPISAGIIAGVSIIGVLVAGANNFLIK